MRIDIDSLTEAELADLNNKKTVTVITEGGERWNVAPGGAPRPSTPWQAAQAEA